MEMPKMKWQEKITSYGIIGGIGAVIFYFWGLIVPFVLNAMENTLHLLLVSLAVGGILYVMFDRSVRTNIYFAYRAIVRALTGVFARIDPIGNLKTLIERAQAKKADLDESVKEMRQQRQEVNNTLLANTKKFEKSMNDLNLDKKQSNDPNEDVKHRANRIIQIESKQVSRLESLVTTQTNHLKGYDMIIKVLSRYVEVCEDAIIDMTNEKDMFAQNRRTSQSFAKGMRSALRLLNGGSLEELEIRELSIETLERDYAKRMGEVEDALQLTKDVILKADFNDESAMQNAEKLLNKWKEGNGNLVIGKNGSGETKQKLIAASEEPIPFKIGMSKSDSVKVRSNSFFD